MNVILLAIVGLDTPHSLISYAESRHRDLLFNFNRILARQAHRESLQGNGIERLHEQPMQLT